MNGLLHRVRYPTEERLCYRRTSPQVENGQAEAMFLDYPSLTIVGSSTPLLFHLLEKSLPRNEHPLVFSFCHLFLLIIGVYQE